MHVWIHGWMGVSPQRIYPQVRLDFGSVVSSSSPELEFCGEQSGFWGGGEGLGDGLSDSGSYL